VADLKFDAAAAHISQWEPSINTYRPDWDPQTLAKLKSELRATALKKDGHFVERFRIDTKFNEE
jgi:hypothetical protein